MRTTTAAAATGRSGTSAADGTDRAARAGGTDGPGRADRRVGRRSAAERREAVLGAALPEFAAGGLAGTSTEAIARRAGISQPYLFRLFPTKVDLFLAVTERCFERVEGAFAAAADGLAGEAALAAMGRAYGRLLADRESLLVQLHVYAACQDERIRTAARRRYGQLWQLVERVSGLPPEAVREFFASGMLLNVAAALDLPSLGERWAQLACLVEPPDS